VRDKFKAQTRIFNERMRPYGVITKELDMCIVNNPADDANITIRIHNNYFPNNNESIQVVYALFIKDKYFISDEKYDIIRKCFNHNLPALNQIKKLREQLNESHIIYSIGSDKVKFIDIKEAIKKKIFLYFSSLNEKQLKKVKELRVKFCADGTNIGKNVFLVNFCFCLLNDKKNKSASGNYTIGMGEIKEVYDALVLPLKYIMEQIEYLKFTFKGKEYKVTFFFGADMKFLLEVNGLKAANSTYPCLWCLCHKNDLHLLGFSILNIEHARDKSKCEDLINQKADYGYKAISLLTEIVLIKCIIDTLHMRLRIGLSLISLFLVNDLIAMDNYEKDLITSDHSNLNIWYYDFLRKKCRIGAKLIPYNQKNKGKITRDFSGAEIITIFRCMDFKTYFPNLEDLEKKQKLWRLFYWIDRGK